MFILVRPPAGVQHWKSTKIVQTRNVADIGPVALCNLQEFPTKFNGGNFIRIQNKDPVSQGLSFRIGPGRLYEACFLVPEHSGAERPGNISSTIVTIHVDHDDFVNPWSD